MTVLSVYKSKRLRWWGVFLAAALPSVVLISLYMFNPRALGIDSTEVLLQESGEWALRFLLITLACSPLKRLGFKAVLKYRRMLGLFSFYYASIHMSTYLFGWIEFDLAQFGEDLIKRPFIYLGMLTWLILFVLAVTSPKWAVKKLRRHWLTLHKGIYLAIVLAWVHLWMQSRASAAEAVVYLAIVTLLLGERIYRSRVAKPRS